MALSAFIGPKLFNVLILYLENMLVVVCTLYTYTRDPEWSWRGGFEWGANKFNSSFSEKNITSCCVIQVNWFVSLVIASYKTIDEISVHFTDIDVYSICLYNIFLVI